MTDDLKKILDPQVLQTIGLLVVLSIAMGPKLMAWWNFQSKGINRRSRDSGTGIDVNRLFDIMEKNIEATNNFAHETKDLSDTIKELAAGLNRRSDLAFRQHEDILDAVDSLDVPRRLTR